MNPLSAVYGQLARIRRTWYEEHPHRQRHLDCPVISVGNLVVGGSGKTPVVAALAEMLRASGYAPAILSRGYARRHSAPGVLVVSDGSGVRADVDASGDEPQMLARQLTRTPVLVSPDRYLAGTLAVRRLGANVLLLDDGFQHVQVARTVDLVLMSPLDLDEAVLPVGSLREPLDAARHADALLVAGTPDEATTLGRRLGVGDVFTVTTRCGDPRAVAPWGVPLASVPRRVVAVAAIARPQRFFAAARAHGFDVVREIAFRDHHWFTARDLGRLQAAARQTGADAILTTEKDSVRLEKWGLGSSAEDSPVPLAFLPLVAHVEPSAAFRNWLLDRLPQAGRSS